MVDDVLANGRRFYRPHGGAFMPVEFQGAAYRFGHSMVRPVLPGEPGRRRRQPVLRLHLRSRTRQGPDPADLRGGCRAPRRFVGWQTFFDFGDGEVKPNKRIDTKISTPLFNLPLGAIASHDPPTALPQRNLLRQLTWSFRRASDSRGRWARPRSRRPTSPSSRGYGLTSSIGRRRSGTTS